MIRLPETYMARLKEQLGPEFEPYLKSLERPVYNGLRVNTLKLSPEAFLKIGQDFTDGPVPWCPEGFYAREGRVPSKHPYYYAGLYYLQEPSAMTPAAVLPVEPGDKVLDLCAAPGGKSTQLLGKLKGQGLLVSNDISPSRAKALLKNLELFGGSNYYVVTEAPYKLAARFPEYFDKILVDAPCSGEGMFHKEPVIVKNWEQYGTAYYAGLQKEILEHAADMLRPGGQMVYSTCTFSPEEDEESLARFLAAHPDFEVVPVGGAEGFDHGHPEWVKEEAFSEQAGELGHALRLWPHRIKGEGHFVALLRKNGPADREAFRPEPAALPKCAEPFLDWCKEALHVSYEDLLPQKTGIRQIGTFLVADPLLRERDKHPMDGIRVLRGGLLLGELKGSRFEPSQALAMAMTAEKARACVNFPAEDPMVLRYLKGETLQTAAPKGWVLVTVDGYPLGWAKSSGGILKNKYLRGWRYV